MFHDQASVIDQDTATLIRFEPEVWQERRGSKKGNIPDRKMADRKMADRKMADRKMADRKMADRKIKTFRYCYYFYVKHFYFCYFYVLCFIYNIEKYSSSDIILN